MVSERPARSTLASTLTGPTSGGRMKCIVAERAVRAGSPIASSKPRITIAITYPPSGPLGVAHPSVIAPSQASSPAGASAVASSNAYSLIGRGTLSASRGLCVTRRV